jgi:DnaJ-class molecular chaperone
MHREKICPVCGGTGYSLDDNDVCYACDGEGYIPTKHHEAVTKPNFVSEYDKFVEDI